MMYLISRSVLLGCGATQLTDAPGRDEDPAWSPDARQVAFSSDRDGNREISIMRRNGSAQTRVTEHPDRDISPSWFPDGQRLAFLSRRLGGNHPAFGPDGFVYFRSNRNGNPDVFRMDTDGSGQELVISSPGDDYPPRWSPDGTQGVYMSDRSGDWEIYRYERSTGRSVRLTQHPGRDWDPWWSPDGSSIASMREVDPEAGHESWEIFGMATDGSGQQALLADGGPNYWPVWSHDGRSLLFLSSRTGTAKMYVRAAEGAVRPVEDGDLASFGARFSRDGSRIVFGGQWIWFDSNRTGNSEIFRIRPDGTGLEQITNQNGPARRASGAAAHPKGA